MKICSIYKHMEAGAVAVPMGANSKLVFRHSIRKKIESGVGREVELTNEGCEMARWFGSNLDVEIGHVASSSCKRNIDTCKWILDGKGVEREIEIASDELECPQAKDLELSSKVFEQYNFESTKIIHDLKTKGLPGFNTIRVASQIMLDYIFKTGNKRDTVDLYCTHDFQMAILYAGLFDYDPTPATLKELKWPMMLEGMILWGEREHFWCAWRNEIRDFISY